MTAPVLDAPRWRQGAAQCLGMLTVDVDVRVEPFDYASGSPATAGLWKVTASSAEGTPVQVFAKLLRHPRLWPRLTDLPPPARDQFVREFPWTFEYDLHLSGIAAAMPDGLRTAELYRADRLDDDHLLLWWEFVVPRETGWQDTDLVRAARLLGSMAARRREGAEVNRGLPPSCLLPRGFALRMLAQYQVLGVVAPRLHDPALWRTPALAAALEVLADPDLPADMVDLAERVPRLLDLMDGLPQTYHHGDASPQNLLLDSSSDEIIVIDWGMGTLQAVGFDLGQLLVGLMHAGQQDPDDAARLAAPLVDAYTAGLAEGGLSTDAATVRTGFLAALACRSALTALPLDRLDEPDTPELRAHLNDRLRLTRAMLDLIRDGLPAAD
ncbi:MAG: phosphotransferase [Nakamurella sp.]